MFTFFWMWVFFLIAGTEGQNCTFPCNWINRDFKMTDVDGETGFWNISETTIVHQQESYTTDYECFQIVGRFIIVRIRPNWLRCFTVEINNADSFTVIRTHPIREFDFTNECNVCHRPNGILMKLSANQTVPECNVPAGCIPDPLHAYNPIVCDNNGNIEDDCNETTTPPPPSPTTPPATPPHRPKHCRHIVP